MITLDPKARSHTSGKHIRKQYFENRDERERERGGERERERENLAAGKHKTLK